MVLMEAKKKKVGILDRNVREEGRGLSPTWPEQVNKERLMPIYMT